MSIASFNPQQDTVIVTPAAAAHFKRQLSASKEASAVRLSVKQSGCTGWMYVVDLVAEAGADDLHVPLETGVELLVDAKSLSVVSGTEIDYVTEGVNRQLKFNNPRAKDYCGCGESFSVN
ncbi:HesB protein [Cellvibrio sp. BR]|jgi:iron-sulfur cluster assembly accessory protein|uniref:HesB/IscA family protein n=1 Tax=unclassified Cellvibrio TaxID=2624793 RepID=UPI0002601870|nr:MULTISPECIES: iron-sulfur cluster assembly accessory protein [unclassified Cellvibrio]EIK45485.1 HesB protein [Cellvibrio sp. BR]UUA73134.1 iron-sulfur cluster assembly accessory protein [Cellvibrio sp. QJXJ]